MKLKDSIALVTGGASGLGQATVEEFVSKGAKAVILDINEDNAKKIIDNLGEDNVLFISTNIIRFRRKNGFCCRAKASRKNHFS